MITITKTITQPEEIINEFADNLGYQSVVKNPDYKPAEGSELIQDPNWVEPEGFDPVNDRAPLVPNPDYKPAVGEPVITNPQTRIEFVSEMFDEMASTWFSQYAERNARRAAEDTVKQTVAATKQAVKATISTAM